MSLYIIIPLSFFAIIGFIYLTTIICRIYPMVEMYISIKALRRSNVLRKIHIYKKKRAREERIPDYLKHNSYDKELNYKIWITKGIRFEASKRCNLLNTYSNKTICLLSVYSIMLSVITVMIPEILPFSPNIVSAVLVCFSVIILVYNQLEVSNNYGIKAAKYHQCAIDLSDVYDDIRYMKSPLCQCNSIDKLKEISNKYEDILKRYDNHEPIDFDHFRLSKRKYFQLTSWQCFCISLTFFLHVRFWYYIFIWTPLIIFFMLIIIKHR